MLPYTEILFPPGSKHSYSNPGIMFLGRIIELLTGDDFEVYVDKNILKPLEDDPQLLRRHAVLPAALALQ
jgi:CubicO group peptidase (beta-lactamase class C family)